MILVCSIYAVFKVRASLSPILACDRDSSHCPSRREDDVMENWQEEHLSAYVVHVIFWVHDLCGVPTAPAEAKKMCGFRTAQDLDDQPSSFYLLPVGNASLHIFLAKGDCISSSSSGMAESFEATALSQVQKWVLLLHHMRGGHLHWTLHCAITEVGGTKSY